MICSRMSAMWSSLARIGWLDASAPFLDLAQRLAAEGPAALREADVHRGDLGAAPVGRADLVLLSYALAEIAPPQQAGSTPAGGPGSPVRRGHPVGRDSYSTR